MHFRDLTKKINLKTLDENKKEFTFWAKSQTVCRKAATLKNNPKIIKLLVTKNSFTGVV